MTYRSLAVFVLAQLFVWSLVWNHVGPRVVYAFASAIVLAMVLLIPLLWCAARRPSGTQASRGRASRPLPAVHAARRSPDR